MVARAGTANGLVSPVSSMGTELTANAVTMTKVASATSVAMTLSARPSRRPLGKMRSSQTIPIQGRTPKIELVNSIQAPATGEVTRLARARHRKPAPHESPMVSKAEPTLFPGRLSSIK